MKQGVILRAIMYQQFAAKLCQGFAPKLYQRFAPRMYHPLAGEIPVPPLSGSGYMVSDMAKLYSAMYHLVTM